MVRNFSVVVPGGSVIALVWRSGAGKTTSPTWSRVFTIRPRGATIRRADVILLMEDGRIIERGTHEELMAAAGAYHGMVLRQMETSAATGAELLP